MRRLAQLSNSCLSACLVFAGLLISGLAVAAESPSAPETKRVLVFSEVGLNAPGLNAIIQQMELTLERAAAPYQIEFYLENLETTLFNDPAAQLELRNWLLHKYRDRSIDLIVLVGPQPLQFLLGSRPLFFPHVPVVICANFKESTQMQFEANYTGVLLALEPQKTIDAALRLLPGTRNIVLVAGSSGLDKDIKLIISKAVEAYRGKFEITYLTNLSMQGTLARLKTLPPHSVVLYSTFWQDADGHRFINATTALPMITEASNAPVFSFSDTYLGRGIVGGFLLQFSEHGRSVAEVIKQLLDGKKPDEIPFRLEAGKYMFDWHALHRWQIGEENLPSNSMVVNRQLTFYEQFKWQLLGTASLLLGLLVFSSYLMWQVRRRRQAELGLRALTGKLIHAQEEERNRLGRDLHDDISQRLAMLCMGIESTIETVTTDPTTASNELCEIWQQASELGVDVHNISRSLHSSVLENLGLVAGIKSLCREFREKTGIDVIFTAGEVPSIGSDAALSLFRVTQEALRNVHKHSGSVQAEVKLEKHERTLRIIIRDQGKGIAAGNGSSGLGMQSMIERLRLVGGRLQVRSETGKGTTIEGSVPLQDVVEEIADDAYGVAQ